MDRFKIKVFFQQFSFLTKGEQPIVPNIDDVEEVYVSRIGVNFLNQRPRSEVIVGRKVQIDEERNIFLLDEDGNVLATVLKDCSYENRYNSEQEEKMGETVGESLLRADPKKVYFAVEVHIGHRLVNHRSCGCKVVVYKPPRGLSLPEWVEEQEKRATEKILAEIAEIDSGGGKSALPTGKMFPEVW